VATPAHGPPFRRPAAFTTGGVVVEWSPVGRGRAQRTRRPAGGGDRSQLLQPWSGGFGEPGPRRAVWRSPGQDGRRGVRRRRGRPGRSCRAGYSMAFDIRSSPNGDADAGGQVMGSAAAHSPRRTLYRELPSPRTLDPRQLMRARERNY
jgi:hypothetical protein